MGREKSPCENIPAIFLHVPTNCLFAGIVVGAVGFHLDRAPIRKKVKMVPGRGVTEAHAFVASLVHLGCTLRVSTGWGRRGRLSHDARGKQGESNRAQECPVHGYP